MNPISQGCPVAGEITVRDILVADLALLVYGSKKNRDEAKLLCQKRSEADRSLNELKCQHGKPVSAATRELQSVLDEVRSLEDAFDELASGLEEASEEIDKARKKIHLANDEAGVFGYAINDQSTTRNISLVENGAASLGIPFAESLLSTRASSRTVEDVRIALETAEMANHRVLDAARKADEKLASPTPSENPPHEAESGSTAMERHVRFILEYLGHAFN